jgi:hypothetical protein
MSFADTLGALLANLSAMTKIPNWTVDSGLLGNSFCIVSVSLDGVIVEVPNAKNYQRIPMKDFAAVYDLWNGYMEGVVKRNEIRNITRYSKYIISINHWLETEIRWKVNSGYNF